MIACVRFSSARVPRCPALLVALTCAAYSPIFDAGFLEYDDPWLIRDNPYFAPDAWHTPWAAFADFSRPARLALGAEYLPLRDLLGWVESRLFGLWPPAWHAVSVLLYVAATLFLRGALLRSFGAKLSVELASLLFALHPVHVESVAWLAGQKDVLALLFVSAALFVHASDGPPRRGAVALLVLCACLSKSMSVAVLVLLGAQDLVKHRRPDPLLYGATSLIIGMVLAVHIHVGRAVGMFAPLAAGTRYGALITMGPVWLRYLVLAFVPVGNSIAYDVPDRAHWDLAALAGYALMLGWLVLAVVRAWSGGVRPLYTFLWFCGPLLPVSQVVAPLQNRMADRYVWLSALAPCLAYGWAVQALTARAAQRWQRPLAYGMSGVLVASGLALTFERALLFGDDLLLFADAARKTVHNASAPLQLGLSLEARGLTDEACVAYREALARAPVGPIPAARRAANALARQLAKQGRLDEAEGILRAAKARFPEDPIVHGNLIKVLRGQGRLDEVEQLERAAPRASQ